MTVVLWLVILFNSLCFLRSTNAWIVSQFPTLTCSHRVGSKRKFTLVSTSFIFQTNNASGDDEAEEIDARAIEFQSALEDRPFSSRTLNRQRNFEAVKRKFTKYGNDLWKLRDHMRDLSHLLIECLASYATNKEDGMKLRIGEIREQLFQAESSDPEFTYAKEIEASGKAQRIRDFRVAKRHYENAMDARSCLPQFNLEGLWVGNYGNHGYELINITYTGDLLIATKVTGDRNIPAGAITFTADLKPFIPSLDSWKSKRVPLKPIILSDAASKEWRCTHLSRFPGQGHVAEEGFINNQFIDGQLILIGEEYFSFYWLPLNHQIFFGRPDPGLCLKLMRDFQRVSERKIRPSPEAEYQEAAIHVNRCYTATRNIIELSESFDGFQ